MVHINSVNMWEIRKDKMKQWVHDAFQMNKKELCSKHYVQSLKKIRREHTEMQRVLVSSSHIVPVNHFILFFIFS